MEKNIYQSMSVYNDICSCWLQLSKYTVIIDNCILESYNKSKL